MEMIGSMKSSSSPSSITMFDSLRHSSIEEMLSELNFLVDESEIRPLTPPRSPIEQLVESSDAQCCENDFVKEINKALHYLYEDSVQNNRARYKKAMAHLNDLLCLYNAQIAHERRSSISGGKASWISLLLLTKVNCLWSVCCAEMSHRSPNAVVKKAAGSTPDCELVLLPGWLIFTAEDCYRKPQYAHFMIENSESLPVVYRIRTKDRSFPQFSHCHGYLPPHGSDEITILITARGHWPREVNEYAGKRLKVLIENLTVPPYTTPPKNANAGAELSRIIFKSTPPLTRMYCKLNIILPKIIEISSEKSTSFI